MLLALTVKNFKSIREARVRFGPLTCVLGHNGVGKSNLFDAIHFLSLLAERDLTVACAEIRRTSDRGGSPLDLVHGRSPETMIELSADMITPHDVVDDFGQPTKASTTLLTYTVRLSYQPATDRLLVAHEQLTHTKLGEYRSFVGFEHVPAFRSSTAFGKRQGGAFISTGEGRISLHGDGGSRGRAAPVGTAPLTVLGGTNTFDYPTVLAAKREMASWRMLQLEPTTMRSTDHRGAAPHVSANGGNLAATLNALIKADPRNATRVVNRLRELNSDIQELDVHVDEVRDQLALRARVPGIQNWLYGRSLSDGTLRYIALAVMLVDADDRGVLCIEEPENGIHPSRIPNLVNLLREYAVDVALPVGDDNPLRQVIINSHSPEVARQIDPEDMLFAERAKSAEGSFVSVFRPIAATWRTKIDKTDSLQPPSKDLQSLADFIGGSRPVHFGGEQLQLNFGTAS